MAENELPFIGDWEGNKVVLWEFQPGQIPVGAINAVGYLRARGTLPMIVHPDRNSDMQLAENRALRQARMFAINYGSIGVRHDR